MDSSLQEHQLSVFSAFPPHYRGMFIEAVAMRVWKLEVGAEELMKELDSL